MISMVMSALILVLPAIFGLLISIYLWRRGLLGRCCLMLIFMAGAVEVHSVVNHQGKIKEKYAELNKGK